MRILWLTDFYPPHIGGLERHVQMIASELAFRDHEVSVATIWHQGTPHFEWDNGVKVYRINGAAQRFTSWFSNTHRRFHPTAPDPLIIKRILELVSKDKPQIVIASGWILHSFLPIKPHSKAKLFVRHHDYAFICPKRTLFLNGAVCTGPGMYKCYPCTAAHYGRLRGPIINTSFKVFSQWHGLVDLHLPISQYVANVLKTAQNIQSDTIHVVPSPVPDEIFESKPQNTIPSQFSAYDDFILYVGALTKTKGLNVLLDAYQGLENRARLVLIGTEWPDSPSIYPEGVLVIKNAPHHTVMEAFSQCLFSVVPSLWPEPFGQVAVEAMAARKPVIASAVGGLTDIIIHEKTGLLIEPAKSSILHHAMSQLLESKGLRQQLGADGYSRAKKLFTRSQVTNQFESIFEEAINSIRPDYEYEIA